MKIRVKLDKHIDSSYDIFIGENIAPGINRLKNIVTDANMRKIHKLNGAMVIPAGEKNKNLKTVELLQEKFLRNNLDRGSTITAFGGGIVGDIAGFAAGTYMRGISYIQVPTTLLAMVDSSIGGKTGVDLKHGKNCSGLFHQPKAVFCDIKFLRTLPEKELLNGMAEIIKYAIIKDASLFSFLEKNRDKILKKNKSALLAIIRKSCMIKARIVEKDEHESGERMLLNFGHTMGHALEIASGYRLPHGRAVSIGMVLESRIANKLGLLKKHGLDRIISLISSYGLPSETKSNPGDILELMKHDKKAVNGKIRFALPIRIGKAVITDNVPEKMVMGALR